MSEPRDWSDDRTLLDGSPLDRARWLLCSEGWLRDAAALDEYVAALDAARKPEDGDPACPDCERTHPWRDHSDPDEESTAFDAARAATPAPALREALSPYPPAPPDWACEWMPDDLNPGPECPYCADQMCARFDGLRCTHNIVERHGYTAALAAAAPAAEGPTLSGRDWWMAAVDYIRKRIDRDPVFSPGSIDAILDDADEYQPAPVAAGLDAGRIERVKQKAVELRAKTEREAISSEDWRFLNGYEYALRDLGILERRRLVSEVEPGAADGGTA